MLEVGLRGKSNGLTTPFFTKNIYAALTVIKKCNNNGFRSAILSDRVYLVCYEDVVNNPTRATQEICSFLQLPWVETMVSSGELNHNGQKVMVDGVWYNEKMFCNNPDASKTAAWKMKLSLLNRVASNCFFFKDDSLTGYNYDFEEKLPFQFRVIEYFYRLYNDFKYKKKLQKILNSRADWVL